MHGRPDFSSMTGHYITFYHIISLSADCCL